MRLLIVNKFLYPNGGSETYIFKLGEQLVRMGHEVEYFGMEHEGRIVGNRVGSYTSGMDFHTSRKTEKLLYPFRIIYSREARRKIRLVLDDFAPDVVHLNNFNFQLTPSIILEVVKYRRQTGRDVKLVYTAHDGQLICPNHLMRNPVSGENCTKCITDGFISCTKGKCIHGSGAKSLLGTLEASVYKKLKVYRYFNVIICPSFFLKERLDTYPVLKSKTVVMHNFVEPASVSAGTGALRKKDYVLYFARFSEEKGTLTLLEVCRQLPEITFVFAGSGPLERKVEEVPNVNNIGFQTGENLQRWIQEARFSVCPSECYENCPLSVMESIAQGTPVIGARIGGIPELIREGETGELFESGNVDELKQKIKRLWKQPEVLRKYTENCRREKFDTAEEYARKLLKAVDVGNGIANSAGYQK